MLVVNLTASCNSLDPELIGVTGLKLIISPQVLAAASDVLEVHWLLPEAIGKSGG